MSCKLFLMHEMSNPKKKIKKNISICHLLKILPSMLSINSCKRVANLHILCLSDNIITSPEPLA